MSSLPGAPSELTAGDVRLLSDIGFVAACSSQPGRAAQIFQALTLFRPLKAFPYLGLAVTHLNARAPVQALQAIALGRRVLGSVAEPSEDLREDLAILGVFEGIAAQADGRRTEGMRLMQEALREAPARGRAWLLGRRLLGLEPIEVESAAAKTGSGPGARG